MATTTQQAASKKSLDAIAMLTADHDKVKKLFKDFEKLVDDENDEEAEQMAQQICDELTIHTTLEEEIFYPALREAIDDDAMLDEAEVEHQSAKDLIAQISGGDAGEDKYAAKVIVLGEYVNHHIKEEQDEMFPKARKAKVDLMELGEEMRARKKELQSEIEADGDDDDEASGNK